MIGKQIKVVVTDDQGATFESAASAAVKQDNTENIEIYDASGAQTDGTGVVGDTLRLTYGSGLGTPKEITWYYNDKVVFSATSQAVPLSDLIELDTNATTPTNFKAICKDGDYYAVIKNQNDEVFTSNTFTLVYKELAATVSNFTIQDDLTDPAHVVGDAKDYLAVYSVTMSKEYEGKFYVYPSDTVKYTKAGAIDDLNNTKTADAAMKNTTAQYTNWQTMNTGSDMTAANAIKYAVNDTKAGIKYVSETGTVTYMWVADTANSNAGLERGKSYKFVYDQAGIDTDDIGSTATTTATVTDAAEMSYLEAPDKFELETVAGGAQVTGTLYKGEEVLSYLGKTTGTALADAGIDSIIVYHNTSAKTDGADKDPVGGGVIKNGKYTSENALTNTSGYFYAVVKTTAGVFGADSITLTSAFKAANLTIGDVPKIAQNADTPSQADITLSGVVGKATVYVWPTTKDDGVTTNTLDTDDITTYRGKVDVVAGQGDATIANVFKKTDISDGSTKRFVATIIPEDTAVYSKNEGDGVTTDQYFDLKQKAKTVQIGDADFVLASPAGGPLVLQGLVAYDQFGSKMQTATTADQTAAVTAINTTAATKESATAKYKINDLGNLTLTVTITQDSGSDADIDDGFSISVLGSTVKITNKNTGNTTFDQDKAKVVVDNTTVLDGSSASAVATAGSISTDSNTPTATATVATAATWAANDAVQITLDGVYDQFGELLAIGSDAPTFTVTAAAVDPDNAITAETGAGVSTAVGANIATAAGRTVITFTCKTAQTNDVVYTITSSTGESFTVTVDVSALTQTTTATNAGITIGAVEAE